MLLDETVSPPRAFQRSITGCEKKYFLTSFWHLGLLSLAKWPSVPLLLQSKVNKDSKWIAVNPLYIFKSSTKSAHKTFRRAWRKTADKLRYGMNKLPRCYSMYNVYNRALHHHCLSDTRAFPPSMTGHFRLLPLIPGRQPVKSSHRKIVWRVERRVWRRCDELTALFDLVRGSVA